MWFQETQPNSDLKEIKSPRPSFGITNDSNLLSKPKRRISPNDYGEFIDFVSSHPKLWPSNNRYGKRNRTTFRQENGESIFSELSFDMNWRTMIRMLSKIKNLHRTNLLIEKQPHLASRNDSLALIYYGTTKNESTNESSNSPTYEKNHSAAMDDDDDDEMMNRNLAEISMVAEEAAQAMEINEADNNTTINMNEVGDKSGNESIKNVGNAVFEGEKLHVNTLEDEVVGFLSKTTGPDSRESQSSDSTTKEIQPNSDLKEMESSWTSSITTNDDDAPPTKKRARPADYAEFIDFLSKYSAIWPSNCHLNRRIIRVFCQQIGESIFSELSFNMNWNSMMKMMSKIGNLYRRNKLFEKQPHLRSREYYLTQIYTTRNESTNDSSNSLTYELNHSAAVNDDNGETIKVAAVAAQAMEIDEADNNTTINTDDVADKSGNESITNVGNAVFEGEKLPLNTLEDEVVGNPSKTTGADSREGHSSDSTTKEMQPNSDLKEIGSWWRPSMTTKDNDTPPTPKNRVRPYDYAEFIDFLLKYPILWPSDRLLGGTNNMMAFHNEFGESIFSELSFDMNWDSMMKLIHKIGNLYRTNKSIKRQPNLVSRKRSLALIYDTTQNESTDESSITGTNEINHSAVMDTNNETPKQSLEETTTVAAVAVQAMKINKTDNNTTIIIDNVKDKAGKKSIRSVRNAVFKGGKLQVNTLEDEVVVDNPSKITGADSRKSQSSDSTTKEIQPNSSLKEMESSLTSSISTNDDDTLPPPSKKRVRPADYAEFIDFLSKYPELWPSEWHLDKRIVGAFRQKVGESIFLELSFNMNWNAMAKMMRKIGNLYRRNKLFEKQPHLRSREYYLAQIYDTTRNESTNGSSITGTNEMNHSAAMDTNNETPKRNLEETTTVAAVAAQAMKINNTDNNTTIIIDDVKDKAGKKSIRSVRNAVFKGGKLQVNTLEDEVVVGNPSKTTGADFRESRSSDSTTKQIRPNSDSKEIESPKPSFSATNGSDLKSKSKRRVIPADYAEFIDFLSKYPELWPSKWHLDRKIIMDFRQKVGQSIFSELNFDVNWVSLMKLIRKIGNGYRTNKLFENQPHLASRKYSLDLIYDTTIYKSTNGSSSSPTYKINHSAAVGDADEILKQNLEGTIKVAAVAAQAMKINKTANNTTIIIDDDVKYKAGKDSITNVRNAVFKGQKLQVDTLIDEVVVGNPSKTTGADLKESRSSNSTTKEMQSNSDLKEIESPRLSYGNDSDLYSKSKKRVTVNDYAEFIDFVSRHPALWPSENRYGGKNKTTFRQECGESIFSELSFNMNWNTMTPMLRKIGNMYRTNTLIEKQPHLVSRKDSLALIYYGTTENESTNECSENSARIQNCGKNEEEIM